MCARMTLEGVYVFLVLVGASIVFLLLIFNIPYLEVPRSVSSKMSGIMKLMAENVWFLIMNFSYVATNTSAMAIGVQWLPVVVPHLCRCAS